MPRKLILLSFIIILIAATTYIVRTYSIRQKVESKTKKISKLEPILQEGDLIFQTSNSTQSKAIQLATHSIYSHCGIVYKEGQDFYVFEAVQPVKKTLLAKWIARGKDGMFVVKRLIKADSVLTQEHLKKLKVAATQFLNKDYDIYFDWSDENIYCSELIWKIYKQALDIEIGHLQQLRDFDLSNPAVKKIMKQRYGNHIPLDETVITPVSIFKSELLRTVTVK